MPKLKLKIDYDINFSLRVTVEAFGYQAVAGVRPKRVAHQRIPRLKKEEVVGLVPTDYSVLTAEVSMTPD